MAPPKVTYSRTRLCFRADEIEPLDWDDRFRIVTPDGTFEMTKRDFYRDFPNVVASASYLTGTRATNSRREYHYWKTPIRAYRYCKDRAAPEPSRKRSPVLVQSLTDSDKIILEQAVAISDSREARNARIVLASANGLSARQIETSLQIDYQTVRHVIARFNERGAEAVLRRSTGTRSPR